MEQLSPSEIIKFRAECYKVSDGAGVYSLYSVKSDLRKLFQADDFANHFRMLTKNAEHTGLVIVAENIKGSLAEVKYIEHISENSELITYYSKTVLTREQNTWKILKEKRELPKLS
ncbi:hypothetical protein Dacet_0419 [Denitrovibrio acetiphilus DSM 12809]|uniref:Uncharacterized protein n=1 Tax=Denitrovibrio acetiphilus (strain DSM 12809 / NBRC 114555 / N2460) TaxID=522772 RepID=D4H3D4_DENA2|nr:hypothetical protein [Denitrovibrio acetiphilus]ADD67218.1 hypothetical protein Dacet_0419 [Denitrovibrio acetiphilus DSM 12809]